MRFSIITPCKIRDRKKIPLLLTNLEDQNFNDVEWIIAYETDNTAKIPKITSKAILTRPLAIPNATTGMALNTAVEHASGDYLIFLDADDLLFPNTLYLVSDLLKEKDRALIDLSVYPTYEPASTILHEIAKDSSFLPKFGGVTFEPGIQSSQATLAQNFKNILASSSVQPNIFKASKRLTNFYDQLYITGKIIKRTLLVQSHEKFNQTNPLDYSNLLMISLGQKLDSFVQLSSPHYIKIRHNDPINDPSLSQSSDSQKWFFMIQNWIDTLQGLHSAIWKDKYIKQCLTYLTTYLCTTLADPEILGAQLKPILNLLRDWLSVLEPKYLKETKLTTRRILQAILQGKDEVAIRRSKILKLLRQINRFRQPGHRSFSSISRLCYQYIFTKLPVKKQVIFYESFLGRNISDSPKYIYEYLQKNYPNKFKSVWVFNPEFMNKPKKAPHTVFVRRFGLRYMYYLAISRYQVINMRQPKWFKKRKGSTFLATWHGTPLKHLVFDMENVASANPLYKQVFYHQSRQWDYLISPNQYSSDIFEHAFMYPKQQMLPTGYPRNDILQAPNKIERAKIIKKKLGIPQDKKVILYAPTWRDNDYFEVGKYKFTLKLDIAQLKAELSKDYVLILRTHYFIANQLDTSEFGDFVYNESTYDDIAELYLVSDILITDYSSVFFDYAILKRPILFYVYDYEEYADVLRGFYLDMQKDLPGPLLKTSDEVLNAIKHLDLTQKKYADRYHKFSARFNAWEDGHATERVVNKVFSKSLKNKKIK